MELTGYVHGHQSSVLAAHGARTAENSAAYLLPLLKPGMSLLDVGCGPGSITLDLAEWVGSVGSAASLQSGDSTHPAHSDHTDHPDHSMGAGQVVGLDPAPAAVERARETAAERGDRVTRFEVGDVYALPCEAGEWDAVHAHQVLQHLPDPVAALREMARVTRPGGIIAVRDADYSGMHWFPETPGMSDWMTTYRALARRNGGEPDAGRRLLSWARAAGLTDVTPSVSTWLYADPTARAWWADSWLGRLRGSNYAGQALDAGLADEAGLVVMEDGWRQWRDAEDAWFVVPHGELIIRV